MSCLRGSAADDVEARAYLALCHRHLLQGRVRLVVVGGLPGTGKSTLAEALGEVLGWPVLRSDEIRKEQAGLDIREHAPAVFEHGLYSPTVTEATYDVCSPERASSSCGSTSSSTRSFSSSKWRRRASDVAAETSSELAELRCVLPAAVAAARLATRAAEGGDVSDADPAIAAAMVGAFDPWPSAVTVGMLPPVDDVVPSVLDRLDSPRPRRQQR